MFTWMMNKQQGRHILLMAIFSNSLLNKNAASDPLEECQRLPNALWDVNAGRCVMCLDCPPGNGYTGTYPCGNGVKGDKGFCKPCNVGEFQSKHGQAQCTTCTQCSDLNRTVTRNCSHELMNSYDTVCGDCLPGYASSPDNTTCVPCPDQTPNSCTSLLQIEPENDETTVMVWYWWVVVVVGGILGLIIIITVIICWRKLPSKQKISWPRPVLPSADVEEINENGDVESGCMETVPNSEVTQVEMAPFLPIATAAECASRRSSSGYISQLDMFTFPHDHSLKHRYEKAVEMLNKDTRCNIPVMDCNINLLQNLSMELNPRVQTGRKNWKHLGSDLRVPNRVLDNCEDKEDPLLLILKYVDSAYGLKLNAFLPVLKGIENHKALGIVVTYVHELFERNNTNMSTSV